MSPASQKHSKIRSHFRKVDSVIYAMMHDLDFDVWIKPRSKKRVQHGHFSALCREIVGQQLSGKVADVIFARFSGLFPNSVIAPTAVLALSGQSLRNVGMSWAKVNYIKALAQEVANQEIDLTTLHRLDDESIIDTLTKVKGIGRWTAEMFLIFTLNREDVFSYGDLGLRRGIEKLYHLKPSSKQITKIVTPWSPYKSYGAITLWHSLDR